MSTPVSESFSAEELLVRVTNTDTGDVPVPAPVRVRVGVAPVHATPPVDDVAVHRLAPAAPPVVLLLLILLLLPPPKLPDLPLQEVAPCIRLATARKHALRILDPLMLRTLLASCASLYIMYAAVGG